MPRRTLVRVLIAIGAAATPAALAAGALLGRGQGQGAFWLLPMVALLCAGALAAWRRPDHLAARRLLLLGTTAVVWIAGALGVVAAERRSGAGGWLVVPATVQIGLDLALPVAILALLAVYPDGSYQRAYERRLVRTGAALAVAVPPLLLVSRATLQLPLSFSWLPPAKPIAVASPLHVDALGFLAGPLSFYARAALGLLTALATAILALRYRRFGPEQRLAIRWPLAALLLIALQPIGNALAAAGALPKVAVDAPVVASLTLLAVALAIGLLNPALFDLGRVVRRSLAYLALWIAVGAAYVGIAAAAGIAAAGEGLRVAVGVAITVTLLAAPVRRALARRATRWIYGARVSGPELLRRVGAALEHTLDPQELATTLAEIVREGLHVDWVRMDVAGLGPVVAGTPPREGAPAGATAPLAYGEESLGRIECAPAVPPVDAVVLGNLARQAALAMGNARLASEVRRRADEVAASRRRLVEAEDTARRRLERDIHDGVQQEIVALIARIGLARSKAERDPALLDATLADLQAEARQALADLRELASGIHPSVLDDHGLVEAIEARAARLPLGVTIECDAGLRSTRFPQPVESAAYFVVCEGFANALKHSGAERVMVRLGLEDHALALELADDGRGFDPSTAGGSGLRGLADRVDAHGGSFRVTSHPGAGTSLSARFPLAAEVPAQVT